MRAPFFGDGKGNFQIRQACLLECNGHRSSRPGLVDRFRSLARASDVSVQRLLLLAVKAFLEAENG